MVTTAKERKQFRDACWNIFIGYPKGTSSRERVVSFAAIQSACPTISEDKLREMYRSYCADTGRTAC